MPKRSIFVAWKDKEHIVRFICKEKGHYQNQCPKDKKTQEWHERKLKPTLKVKSEITFNFLAIYNNALYDHDGYVNELEKENLYDFNVSYNSVIDIFRINFRIMHDINENSRIWKLKKNKFGGKN